MNEFDEGIFERDPYNYLSRCPDPEIDRLMVEEIVKVKNEGDSIGGTISCYIYGIPTGIGEPLFNKIESNLASAMFSIPGTRAIEFGTGFRLAQMKGSEANDQLYYNSQKDRFKTKTNHNGGILGGISTGISPITFRLAFKPTPSIHKPQHTVNLKTKENIVIKTVGRFDPCIVPRAVIIVEQLAALVFADLFLLAEVSKPKKS
jgi:chorismate synthase